MKIFRKIIISILVAGVILVVAAVILGRIYEEEITQYIVSGFNKQIKTEAKVGDVKLIIHITDENLDFLIEVGNALEDIDQGIVAIMFSSDVNRYLVKAGKGALSKGVHAGNLTSKVAEIIGGRGGGQPHFGQGAGSNRERFEASRIAFKKALEMQLELQP